MLTVMEVPGIYLRPDTGAIHVFDHVEATPVLENGALTAVRLRNPTAFPS